MPLFLQHLYRIGNIFGSQSRKSQALCLKMNAVKQRKVIEKRRDDGRQHHPGIADRHELRHDKSHGAHDRRGKLSASGGHRLHRSGKFLFISGLLHQRNRDGSGCGHIGNCRAVNHAHQRRGDDRNLGRSTGRASHQCQADIIDKLGKSAVFKEGTKQNKDENIGSRYTGARSKNANGIPYQRFNHPFQGKRRCPECPGNIASPYGKVGKENECNDGQIAGGTSCCLKGQYQTDDANPDIGIVQPARLGHCIIPP